VVLICAVCGFATVLVLIDMIRFLRQPFS
jgi:hypothetical protein